METYKPRPRWLGEDYERFIIRSVEAIVIPELGIDPPIVDLMVRSDESDASISFEYPVGGLCDPSGLHVYLLRHLPPLFLARATAHELRHARQAQKHLNLTKAQRERD